MRGRMVPVATIWADTGIVPLGVPVARWDQRTYGGCERQALLS